MVKLAEYSRTATFAWSNDKLPSLVTGTAAGTVDANFSNDSTLELWSLLSTKSDKPIASLKTDSKFNDLDWSTDNKYIVGAFDNGSIELFNTNDSKTTLKSIAKFVKHTSSVNTVKFNPKQSNLFVSGGARNGEIFIWDTNKCTNGSDYTPILPGSAMTAMDEIKSLAWNQSLAHVFASAGNNNYASIWDLKAKKEVIHLNFTSPITGIKSQLSVVEWHPSNSTRVATASGSDNDPSILIWDLRNANTPLQSLSNGHSKGILSMDWCSQDDNLLLSSGRDNTVLLWNPEEGKLLSQFPSRTNWSFKTKFAPAAPDIFASASFDSKIEIQTLQNVVNTLDQQENENKSKESESDFWNHVSEEESNEKPTVTNLQAPKWYGNKSPAANWAFGGKLVQITEDGKGISIIKPVIQGLESNEILGEALKTKDFKPLINLRLVKTVNKTNEEDWSLLEKLSMDGKQDFLKDAFAFDDEDNEEESTENIDDGEKFFDKIESDFIPTGQYKIDSEKEDNISKDLIKGNFDSAISKSLENDLLLEALVMALDSTDETVKDIVKNTYFAKYANKSSLSRIMYSTQKKDIEDMVDNLNIDQWKYTVKAIYNYFQDDQTKKNELLVKLGERLLDNNMRQDALIIYFAANSLDKVSSIWIKEFNSMEDNLKEQKKTVYEAHSECLTEFIEKFTVLSSFLGGNLVINSDELISKFLEFVNLTSASGNFDLASAFLENLPGDNKEVNTEKERVQIASGKPIRTASNKVQQSRGRTTNIGIPPLVQTPQVHANVQPLMRGVQVPTPTQQFAPLPVPVGNRAGSGIYSPAAITTQLPPSNLVVQPQTSSFMQPANPYAQPVNSYEPVANNNVPPAFSPMGQAVMNNNRTPPPQGVNGVVSGQKPHLNRKANYGWNDLTLSVEKNPVRAKAVSVAPAPAPVAASPTMAANTVPPPPLSRISSSVISSTPPPVTGRSRKPSHVGMKITENPLPALPKANNPYAPQIENVAPISPAPVASISAPSNPYAPTSAVSASPQQKPSAYAPTQVATPHSSFSAPSINAGSTVPQPSNPYAPKQQNPYSQPPMGRDMNGSYPQPTPVQAPVGPPPTNLKKRTPKFGNVENATSLLDSMRGSASQISTPPISNTPPINGNAAAVPVQAAQPIATAPASAPAEISADQQSIIDFLQEELARVTPLTPKEYTKQLKDCDKRLKILFVHLERGDLLTEPTIEKLKELIEFLKTKNYTAAMNVHVDIATNHAHEGGNWLTGVKRLISIAEATSN